MSGKLAGPPPDIFWLKSLISVMTRREPFSWAAELGKAAVSQPEWITAAGSDESMSKPGMSIRVRAFSALPSNGTWCRMLSSCSVCPDEATRCAWHHF